MNKILRLIWVLFLFSCIKGVQEDKLQVEVDHVRMELNSVSDAMVSAQDSVYFFQFIMKEVDQDSARDILYRNIFTEADFDNRIHKLNFGMKDNFYLEVGSFKIPSSIVHFENNYNLGGFRKFIIGFPVRSAVSQLRNQDKLHFVFDDDEFGVGKTTFLIKKSDLTSKYLKYHGS